MDGLGNEPCHPENEDSWIINLFHTWRWISAMFLVSTMRIWPWTRRKALRWCGMRSCSQKGRISNYRRWVQHQDNENDCASIQCGIMAIKMMMSAGCLQIKSPTMELAFFLLWSANNIIAYCFGFKLFGQVVRLAAASWALPHSLGFVWNAADCDYVFIILELLPFHWRCLQSVWFDIFVPFC